MSIDNKENSLQGKRILVVDDDRFHQYFTRIILNKLQIVSTLTHGGEAAIKAFDDEQYDLVLLDLKMPNVDGYAVLSHIRETRKSKLPVLILTGAVMDENINTLIEPGYTELLQKPFGARDLKQTLMGLIGTLSSSNFSTAPLYDITKLKYMARGDHNFERELIKKMIDSFDRLVAVLSDQHYDFTTIKTASEKLQLSAKVLASDRILSLLRKVNQAATEQNREEMNLQIKKLHYWTSILSRQLRNYYKQ